MRCWKNPALTSTAHCSFTPTAKKSSSSSLRTKKRTFPAKETAKIALCSFIAANTATGVLAQCTATDVKKPNRMELTRSKLSVDRLTLRQKEGFLSVLPIGANQFGAQYERVLPASSVANLYPFNFSGKTDPQGLYLGRDKFGSNILVDFDRRTEDKTTGNILILGNSGQGKSYLLKLILTNLRESGKAVICLDPEAEYEELCASLGGCYIDFLSGQYTINPPVLSCCSTATLRQNPCDNYKQCNERKTPSSVIWFNVDIISCHCYSPFLYNYL